MISSRALWSPISLHCSWPALLLVTFTFLQQPAVAQPSSGEPLSTPVLLSVEKVVANLVRMNSQRAQALRSYQGLRTYRVEYRGFPSIVAESAAIAVQFSVISGMRASTARAKKIDVAAVTITQSRQLRW